MIRLITGLPGNGKTLYAINYLYDLNQKAETDTVIAEREIIVIGIILNLEYFPKLNIKIHDYADFVHWKDNYKDCLIIVDEAQKVLPQRMKGTAPEFITELSEHRHYGLDIYLITQDTRLIDAWSRRLVNEHVHVKRLFSTSIQVLFVWDKAIVDVSDRREIKYSVKKWQLLNKKLYQMYKSASSHTHKSKVPLSVKIVLLFILLMSLTIIYWLFYADKNPISEKTINQQVKNTTNTTNQVFTPSPVLPIIKNTNEFSSLLDGDIFIVLYSSNDYKFKIISGNKRYILNKKLLDSKKVIISYYSECYITLKYRGKSYIASCQDGGYKNYRPKRKGDNSDIHNATQNLRKSIQSINPVGG